MSVLIHKSAQALGIVNPAFCLISGVTVSKELSTVYTGEITNLMEKVSRSAADFLSQPHVPGFRKLFSDMGYANLEPAGERLLRSFKEKGFKQFNNIVDAYNIVSMESVSGIGMHGVDSIEGAKLNLSVWRATGEEKVVPMFKDKVAAVKSGDLVYGLKEGATPELLAWLGKKDVDSNTFKVEDRTTQLLLVVLGNTQTTQEYNNSLCSRIFTLIQMSCPGATMKMIPVTKEV